MFLRRWRRRSERDEETEAWRTALAEARRQKDHHFQHAPDSPIPTQDRGTFEGLTYYDPDPAYRVVVRPEHLRDEPPLTIPTSTGDVQTYEPVARLACPLPEGEAVLTAYAQGPNWFIPFKDATNGKETYGGGRYLEVPPAGDEVLVDFNLTYNPYCAYSDQWSCPLPPPDNWLQLPVRAGEREYAPA